MCWSHLSAMLRMQGHCVLTLFVLTWAISITGIGNASGVFPGVKLAIRNQQLQEKSEDSKTRKRIRQLLELAEKTDDAKKILELTNEVTRIVATQPDPKLEAQVFIQRSRAHQLNGDYELSLNDASAAKDLADECQEDSILAQALYYMSIAQWRQSRPDLALAYADDARQPQESINVPDALARTLTLLGAIYRSQSSYDKAIEMHFEALRISEKFNNDSAKARSLNNIGLIYWNLGRNDEAYELLLKALNYYRQTNELRKMQMCLSNMAMLLVELGRPSESLSYLDESLSLSLKTGNDLSRAKVLSNLAFAHNKLGNQEKSLELYESALELRNQIGDQQGIIRTSGCIASIFQDRGDHKTALEMLENALEMAQSIGARAEQACLLELISTSRAELGNHSQALKDHQDFHALQLELHGVEVQQKIAELENRFAHERSQREKKELSHRLENRKQQIRKQKIGQNRLLATSICLGICLLLLTGVFYSRVKALRAMRGANKELVLKTNQLGESELRYRTLFDNAEAPTMLIDEESSTLVEMNLPARELCRNLPEDGQLAVSSIEPAWVRKLLEQHLAKDTVGSFDEDVWVERSGNLRFAEIRSTTVALVGRKARLVRIRDTTELRNQEKASIRTDRLDSLGVLAGGIAHDFNNALTAIRGFIALAKGKKDCSDELELAEQAASQAGRLTTQLLTFSKGGEPVRRVQNINKLLTQAVGMAGAGSHMSVQLNIENDLWPVDLDSGQFTQVVSNLVLNAGQATDQGGTLQISATNFSGIPKLGVSEEGAYVQISFVDNGVGIANEIRDSIFDPYFTTKQDGNGLGLSTVYAVVNRHDGLVTVKSRAGVGSEFTIFLPASTELPALSQPHSGNSQMCGNGSLLVLEDDLLVQKVYRMMIRQWGFDFEIVSDGEAAVDLYRERIKSNQPFDLVIMDLTIRGGMGGRDAMAEILKFDSEAKAIVASGYSDDPTMANYQEAGFLAAIEKPFSTEELANVVSKILQRPIRDRRLKEIL